MKALESTLTNRKVYRLPTQEKRAAFVRKEMRRRGLDVQGLSELADISWWTAAGYADLRGGGQPATMNPYTDTTRKIFHALGYDLCFTSKESKGIIEL